MMPPTGRDLLADHNFNPRTTPLPLLADPCPLLPVCCLRPSCSLCPPLLRPVRSFAARMQNFGMVETDLYRSGQPNELNLPYLEQLNLRTIIFLSAEEPSLHL